MHRRHLIEILHNAHPTFSNNWLGWFRFRRLNRVLLNRWPRLRSNHSANNNIFIVIVIDRNIVVVGCESSFSTNFRRHVWILILLRRWSSHNVLRGALWSSRSLRTELLLILIWKAWWSLKLLLLLLRRRWPKLLLWLIWINGSRWTYRLLINVWWNIPNQRLLLLIWIYWWSHSGIRKSLLRRSNYRLTLRVLLNVLLTRSWLTKTLRWLLLLWLGRPRLKMLLLLLRLIIRRLLNVSFDWLAINI